MSAVIDLVRLNGPERRLVKAAEEGEVADLRGHADGEEPVIRAWVLRGLSAGDHQWKVKDRIHMVGGIVRGRLDLLGQHLVHPLYFADCVFEDTIDLRRARADVPIEWVGEHGARTAEILADEFESSSDLTIRNVTVTDVISLHWASVRGDVRLTGSALTSARGQTLNGADLRVGGTLFLDGQFRSEGEVCLQSAHIGGHVDCRNAHFDNPAGVSLKADHMVVDGEVLMESLHADSANSDRKDGFDGEVNLEWAEVHRLRATGARFASNTGYALHADALHAGDGVYLDRNFHASGCVRLVGAYITGELCCTHGTFHNPEGRALDAERIEAEDVYLDQGFTAEGEVRFVSAKVRRQFNATNGTFLNKHAKGCALDLDSLDCDGEVFLNDGFNATGPVSLTGAEIAGELNCTSGSFTNDGGDALFADGLSTRGFVYLDQRFHAKGEVRLARATVGRQLVCTGGVFDNQHGCSLDITGLECSGDVLLRQGGNGTDGFRATGQIVMRDAYIRRDLDFTNARLHGGEGIDARGAQVSGCMIWILDQEPEGPVDLTGAHISRLLDTRQSWPKDRYTLAGFTYQSTAGSLVTVPERITWLQETKKYSPEPYQQLAQVFRLTGDESTAEKILIASQRDLRKRGSLPRHSRMWNRFIDYSVGYGYRLWRPFLAVLVLGLLGWWFYHLAQVSNLIFATGRADYSAARACPSGYPCFYPAPYSFQLLIPGLDLREATQWLPDAGQKPWGLIMMIYTWLMIIFGWIAATAVVAGVTRIFRKR